MRKEEVLSRRRAPMLLTSILILFIFSGWNVNRSLGFLVSQPRQRLDPVGKDLFPSSQWILLQQSTTSEAWLPMDLMPPDRRIENEDSWREEVESKSLKLVRNLIRERLNLTRADGVERPSPSPLVLGKFVDLCCTLEGERSLERIFEQRLVEDVEESIVLGAVACFHSLLVMGMSYGLSGTPEQFDRWTAHLKEPEDENTSIQDFMNWDVDSSRRLKYQNDRSAAVKVLTQVMRKQTPQGAFDLLVSLEVWNKNEDLVLLRSGFPIRFSDAETKAAADLLNQNDRGMNDPDTLLGIRKDLRSMKVVTIDSASTSEIDDGVGCEEYTTDDGLKKLRYWIHIADADHVAKRDSLSFRGARRRATSHYLPDITIPMFPSM